MPTPYVDSRVDELLDLYCTDCGHPRRHLTNHPVRPCPNCGKEFGLTNRPRPDGSILGKPPVLDTPDGSVVQATLFDEESTPWPC